MSIYTKSGQKQFWGTPTNPEHFGIAFSEDCCSCFTGCLIYQDNFGAEEINNKWSEESGSWTIDTNNLVISDTNAYLKLLTNHSLGVAEHSVSLYLQMGTSYNQLGDKIRIVLCDCLYAELEFGISGSIDPKCFVTRLFYEDQLLTESQRFTVDTPSDSYSSFRAGYSAETGIFWSSYASIWLLDIPPFRSPLPSCIFVNVKEIPSIPEITGTNVGIGTGDTVNTEIRINEFIWRIHNHGDITDCDDICDSHILVDCNIITPVYIDDETWDTPITNLNCGWKIQSGIWTPTTDFSKCLTTSDSNAIIECETKQSENTCVQYDPAGYHYASCQFKGSVGDECSIFLDWDGTIGHECRLTYGDYSGNGGMIALYKGDDLLNSKSLSIVADGWYYVECGLRKGSEFDFIQCRHSLDNKNSLSSITTPYGNSQIGFGTRNVNNLVQWYFNGWSTGRSNHASVPAQPEDCFYFATTTCGICPESIGPTNGFAIAISGLDNNGPRFCNCTSLNGTSLIPWGTAMLYPYCKGISTVTCNGDQFSQSWEIISLYASNQWKLEVTLSMRSFGAMYYLTTATYERIFSLSNPPDFCFNVIDQSLDLVTVSHGPYGGYCTGWESLDVRATSY